MVVHFGVFNKVIRLLQIFNKLMSVVVSISVANILAVLPRLSGISWSTLVSWTSIESDSSDPISTHQ